MRLHDLRLIYMETLILAFIAGTSSGYVLSRIRENLKHPRLRLPDPSLNLYLD